MTKCNNCGAPTSDQMHHDGECGYCGHALAILPSYGTYQYHSNSSTGLWSWLFNGCGSTCPAGGGAFRRGTYSGGCR